MNSYLFYSSTKTIKTKFTATIPDGNLVPLNNYHIWILYSNGEWILHDLANNILISQGTVDKPSQSQQYLTKSPKALSAEDIIYINCATLKLECLNPYTGILNSAWTGDVPSVEILPSRDDIAKANDTLLETRLEILKDSKTVGIIEMKDPSEYFLSIFQENKKRVLQVSYKSERKKMELSKGNEVDTFLLWESYQDVDFKFLLFNIDQQDKGFQKFNLKGKLKLTVTDSFPWDANHVIFFGNPDESGIPQKCLYNFKTNEFQTEAIYDKSFNKPGILTRAIFVNSQKNQVLFSEIFDTPSMVLYNLKANKADFVKTVAQNESSVAVDTSGNYFVTYAGVRFGEKFSKNPGETVLKVNHFSSIKMAVLHIMKNAKLKNGKSYMEYYGDTYVVKHVADMLG